MEKKKINIRPATSVYGTYKRLSYQPWTAIAEFVDNSTQSYYDHKDKLKLTHEFKNLFIEIQYNENEDKLIIRDNAFGMDFEDFKRAIMLDKPPLNRNGRNEFGMGLKTAACWFGGTWTVESKMYGSTELYTATVDVDKLERDKDEEIDVDISKAPIEQHYTVITIERLHRKIKGSRTVSRIKEQLRSIYRVDLRTEDIKILYNGESLTYNEPSIYEEVQDDKREIWKKQINFSIDYNGETLNVKGFIGIRYPGSVRDGGFTLIRRGRVIIGGPEKNYRPSEIFGQYNSFASQRLFGEIYMDNWPVTQAKDDFDWHNSGLEDVFIDKLKDCTHDFKEKAESIRVRPKLKNNELIENTINIFSKSGLLKEVKKIETIKDDNETNVTNNLEYLENKSKENEENFGKKIHEPVDNIVENNTEIKEVKEEHDYQVISFKYFDINYIFRIEFYKADEYKNWVVIERSENYGDNKYKIIFNMRHAFFQPYINDPNFIKLMQNFIIALALAEIEAIETAEKGLVDPSTIRVKMNNILETLARRGECNNE